MLTTLVPSGRTFLLAASVPAIAILLSGCVASTKLVQNDKPSVEVKAKSYRDYKEVLFVAPKEDPRNVVPRARAELESMGFKVQVVGSDAPLEASQGTGFAISKSGYLLTCAHVLGEQQVATITRDGVRLQADVIRSDKAADLALLKLREPLPGSMSVLSFRGRAQEYAMGEDVYTIGYPLSHLLGNGARMTKGLLSATSGLHDDPKQLQVSAEIQPGNSGGPLLNHDGEIVGVVEQTMNPWRVAQATGGALPQNINFSIKNDPVLDFLKDADATAFAELRFDQPDGLERATHAVVKVQAGVVDDSNRADRMVVRLFYRSHWDVWFRFTAFVVTAYDFDTQEPLFAAGQGHDNMVSNEDVVIKDTFAQFRKALATR